MASHWSVSPCQRLSAQDSGDLPIIDEDVVRPFEARPRPRERRRARTEHGLHDIGENEAHAQRQHARRWERRRRPQQHPEPHATRGRPPRPAVAAPPRSLLLGKHHGSARRPLRAEVVNGVETGRERTKQPRTAARPSDAPGLRRGCRRSLAVPQCVREREQTDRQTVGRE